MLECNDVQPYFTPVTPSENVPNSSNAVFLQYNNNSTISTDVASSKSDSISNGQCAVKKDIYVCTFCQVFSPNLTTVSNHISVVHSESLPVGNKPEDFVSKLQSLDENHQKTKGRRGRPKKSQVESTIPEISKQKIVSPVPDSEGLFWCKTCLKHFKKSRQLMQHICLDLEEEGSSEESPVGSDEDVEFRTYMDIDPSPWSRTRRNRHLKENSVEEANSTISSTESDKPVENKIIPNWRKDPSYIPLFDNEKEKAAFEEHLKSIDYSYVDNMYQIIEIKNSKNSMNNASVIFSCDFCNKEYKSLSLIRAHCVIHTDAKPFTCPKCSYRANSSGSLYFHMRKHTGNVYWCSFCDFKCLKRSHLLDHEATHSTVYQTCKLCKNSYKTLKSLINHVRKYHNYHNGKKYLKSLTCKQSKFMCNICNKKFKTLNILNNHNHACHENTPPPDITSVEEIPSEQISENINHEVQIDDQLHMNDANNVELPAADLQCNNMQTKDPLAEMVLNDFLQQQQQSQDIMYQNVFNQAHENIISSSSNNLLSNLQAKVMVKRLAETSILEECQKTLDLDILKECLQSSGFSNECDNFSLIPNIAREHSLQNNSENNSDVANHLSDISEDKMEEPKSVEIKLFEKCQRAPAYVCCVCSSIYICPATLKAHLREHVNSTISSFMDQAEEQQFENTPTKVAETSNELDVCEILQDSSESFKKELEKLYISSLDLMYYLPEVSVVVENDAALFDSVLDDISNFPISDNTQDLDEKAEEENVLKMFSGDASPEQSF